jgi:septum formation protein
MLNQKIILASKSPRRKQLLEWAEIDFEVHIADTDEIFPKNSTFENAAIHIARNKALAIHAKGFSLPILAADTIVVCQNQVIGKPVDKQDAVRILKMLSGREHTVITGVCILSNEKQISFADVTKVCFNQLSTEQILFYVDKYQPYDKAGAYAIQEWIGIVGIKYISGDFYNVMGLPINRVVQALQSLMGK